MAKNCAYIGSHGVVVVCFLTLVFLSVDETFKNKQRSHPRWFVKEASLLGSELKINPRVLVTGRKNVIRSKTNLRLSWCPFYKLSFFPVC